jgi:hypothetical protein
MDSVAALGEVESRSVGIEDVTDRVIDAEARLTAELAVTLRQRPVLGPLGVVAAGLATGVRKLFLWR